MLQHYFFFLQHGDPVIAKKKKWHGQQQGEQKKKQNKAGQHSSTWHEYDNGSFFLLLMVLDVVIKKMYRSYDQGMKFPFGSKRFWCSRLATGTITASVSGGNSYKKKCPSSDLGLLLFLLQREET